MPVPLAARMAIADRLSWLEGTWVSRADPDRTTTEIWVRDGERLRATVENRKGDELEFTETIVIETRNDGVYYVASPSGQATTAFKLVRQDHQIVVFENPEHDFPKRIRYARHGNELRARIVGDGKSSEWRYQRQ